MALNFVTTNSHKFHEVERIAREYGIEVIHRNLPYTEIQSDTIEDVARAGAREACGSLGVPCFVEDSGLFIKALGGFPGPYSKFVFKTIGNRGILKLMRGETDRRAEFMSSVGYCEPGKDPVVFTASAPGRIADSAMGSHGFGYDPIFIPDAGDGRTFGEMTIDEKNLFSHRNMAIRKFMTWLSGSA
ncbi:MAG: XTP/dITP diphosphatase [Candidatus Hadarchaeales archaeon]